MLSIFRYIDNIVKISLRRIEAAEVPQIAHDAGAIYGAVRTGKHRCEWAKISVLSPFSTMFLGPHSAVNGPNIGFYGTDLFPCGTKPRALQAIWA